MLPRYAGIIQISLEGLFSAPPINGAPLEIGDKGTKKN